VLFFYACGLSVALSLRRPVLVRVSPERATLYRIADGRVYNRFRYNIANRGSKPSSVVFSLQQLPAATLAIEQNPVSVTPGESASGTFEISVPAGRQNELVTHFAIIATTLPGQVNDTIPMTFLAPSESK
jgi:hypothetical protein